MIECENADERSQASGFFVRPGIVVTNYHVIKNMEKGKIRIVGGQIKGRRIFRITAILAIDERGDLALLGVLDAKRAGVSTLPLAASKAAVGETVYAFGNPEGLAGIMSPGIVSAGLRVFNETPLLQITAPISHGSSGGPVVNSRGQVIGIAVGSLTEGQNLNFAVPASLITSLVSRWESGNSGYFASNIWDLIDPPEGAVEGAWMLLAIPATSSASMAKPSRPISAIGPVLQGESSATASLRKLTGVRVVIDLDSDVQELIREEQVRTDIELRLRRNGIRVLTADEGSRTPGRPQLVLAARIMKIEGAPTYVLFFNLKLSQRVALERDSTFFMTAATWQEPKIGYVGRDSAISFIKESIGQMVDSFCNEYLGANQ